MSWIRKHVSSVVVNPMRLQWMLLKPPLWPRRCERSQSGEGLAHRIRKSAWNGGTASHQTEPALLLVRCLLLHEVALNGLSPKPGIESPPNARTWKLHFLPFPKQEITQNVVGSGAVKIFTAFLACGSRKKGTKHECKVDYLGDHFWTAAHPASGIWKLSPVTVGSPVRSTNDWGPILPVTQESLRKQGGKSIDPISLQLDSINNDRRKSGTWRRRRARIIMGGWAVVTRCWIWFSPRHICVGG